MANHTKFEAAIRSPSEKLTISRVLELAKQHFPEESASVATTAAKRTTTRAKATTEKGDRKPQWTNILSSKEFGLPAYFTKDAEEMKRATKGLNHFVLVKQLRDKYEGKPEWDAYIASVKAKHPQSAELTDRPTPRKTAAATPTPSVSGGGGAVAPVADAEVAVEAEAEGELSV